MHQKLKIGLLLDSVMISAWQFAMIKRIASSSYAQIELLVLNDGGSLYKSKYDKLQKNWHQIIYYLFNTFDRKISMRNPDAFEKLNLSEMLQDCPKLKVRPIRKKYSDYFVNEDIEKIKEYKIDIFVRMGFRILRGEILKTAKYGIWSFHHGDNMVNRGGPPGFWEVVENWPVTGSILQIISEELDGGMVLYRSWSCTLNLNIGKNKNRYYWKSLSFLPRKIEELYNIGDKKFFEKVNAYNKEIDLYTGRLYKAPSNLAALKLSCRQLMKIMIYIIRKLFHLNQWILLYSLKEDISMSPEKFRKIIPPKDRFWADPHVIKQNSKYYIFIEEYLFDIKKGHISVIEIDERGNIGETEKVLERDYHLSYPHIFKFNERIYMVPESHENSTIELYGSVDFPYKWEHKMNLMENLNAVDTTLFYHNNKWWLFTAIKEYEGAARDELYIYYADELLTKDWKAHPLNPVISDVRVARPAGRIFKRNGRIYRPSQNGSYHYGYGFHIQEIEVLTETDFREKTIMSAKPKWEKSIIGTHTFAYEEGLTVIDALKRRSKLYL